MPLVRFIGSDGIETELDVPEGWSLMQAATLNGVAGIDGECGGSLVCATCHCYIEEDKLALLPPISDAEEEMLQLTASERKTNSRLGCQIPITPALDGLVVRLPDKQS